MKDRTHIKKIIRIAIIGIAIVGMEAGVLLWLKGRIETRAQAIHAARSVVVLKKRDQGEFAVLKNDYEKIRQLLPRVQSALPHPEDLFGILTELERIAARTGNRTTIVIENHEPQASAISGVRFVAFSGELEGSYATLRNYLKELERAPFFAVVESVGITSATAIASGGKTRITGKIYLK